MTSLPLVTTEVGYKSERLPTACLSANVRPGACVNPDVLCPSPRPLECHLAALPGTLEGTIIDVDSPMLH